MKKAFAFVIAMMTLVSCGIFATSPEEEAEIAAKVVEAVEAGDFVISIRTVFPQRGPAIHCNGDYTFKYKDGLANTRLPFFGVSETAVFGTDESSIVLTDYPIEPNLRTVKDSYIYSFAARVGGNTVWNVDIRIWQNGSVDITARCPTKSMMRYDGELVFGSEED